MTTRYLCTLLVWLSYCHVTGCASLFVRDESGNSDIPQIFHAKELKSKTAKSNEDENYAAFGNGKFDYYIVPREAHAQEKTPLEKGLWGKRYIEQIFPPIPVVPPSRRSYRGKKSILKYHVIPVVVRSFKRSQRKLNDENDIIAGSADSTVPIEKGLWGKRDITRSDRMFYEDSPNDIQGGDMSDYSTEQRLQYLVPEDQVPREETDDGAFAVLEKGLWGKRDSQQEIDDSASIVSNKREFIDRDSRSGNKMRTYSNRIGLVQKRYVK